MYDKIGKAEISNYCPLRTESCNVDPAASESPKSDGGSPTLNLNKEFGGSMRDNIPRHHNGIPKHLGCSRSPPCLPASLSSLNSLRPPQNGLLHTAAPACEEKSDTQQFQPFKSSHFDVQEVRQPGLTVSSGAWESILVLAGIELSQLCGA